MLRREALKLIGSIPLISQLPHVDKISQTLPNNVKWNFFNKEHIHKNYIHYENGSYYKNQIPCIYVDDKFHLVSTTETAPNHCYGIILHKLENQTIEEYVNEALIKYGLTDCDIYGYLYQDYVGLLAVSENNEC